MLLSRQRARTKGATQTTKSMEQITVQGTVKFFKKDKGFGFIQRDGGGADLFVHISQCDESIDTLVRGQRVEFEEGTSSRSGKPEARRVIVIEASVERVRRYG